VDEDDGWRVGRGDDQPARQLHAVAGAELNHARECLLFARRASRGPSDWPRRPQRATRASVHARTISDASAISPRRAQAGSLRNQSRAPSSTSPLPNRLSRSRAAHQAVLHASIAYPDAHRLPLGQGRAQRVRRLVWTRWPMEWRDCVLQWPYQTRRVPIYTSANPLEDRLTCGMRTDRTLRVHRKGETAWLACQPPTRRRSRPSNVTLTLSN
jgi:hypothetical protein